MTREELQNWIMSDYDDGDLEYYVNGQHLEIGDTAYLYSVEEEDEYNEGLLEMEIIHIIFRSDDMEHYDKLLENEDVLLDGEDEYNADTSCEFITDDDCFLVWFKYR